MQERAKGTAAQFKAGAGKAEDTTGNTKRQASLMQRWQAQIRSRVERQKRGKPDKGRVRLILSVHTGGKLQGVSIRRSSGNSELDAAAVAAARRAKPPAAPKGIKPGTYSFGITMVF